MLIKIFGLVNSAQKLREKKTLDRELNEYKDQQNVFNLDQQQNTINNNDLNETKEQPSDVFLKHKRNVSFANEVNIINDNNKEIEEQQINIIENQPKEKLFSIKSHLPLASDTLVDKMDSNLRMFIIKELSQDSYVQRPLSKRS
jgi:hypothetical protein